MANPILTVPKHTETWRFLQLQVTVCAFFLFSWPVLGDETLNSYLPTTMKMRGTSLTCIYCTENLSPFWSLLAHPARGAYLGFLRVLLLPPVWDASPSQGYPLAFHRASLKIRQKPFILPAGERGTVRGKCHAQEHKTLTRPGLEPRPLDPKSYALTVWRLCHPYNADDSANNAPTLKVLTTCYRIQIAPGYARGVRLRFPLAPIIFCKAKNCKWIAP